MAAKNAKDAKKVGRSTAKAQRMARAQSAAFYSSRAFKKKRTHATKFADIDEYQKFNFDSISKFTGG
jgi:hypothetical protein